VAVNWSKIEKDFDPLTNSFSEGETERHCQHKCIDHIFCLRGKIRDYSIFQLWAYSSPGDRSFELLTATKQLSVRPR